jgi:hypothetical protein
MSGASGLTYRFSTHFYEMTMAVGSFACARTPERRKDMAKVIRIYRTGGPEVMV